jgi:hypothetical protein
MNTLSSFNSHQCGKKNGDTINIHTWFSVNTDTNEVTVKCKIAKNWLINEEILFEGTAKECVEFAHNFLYN